jgi:outer membrane immunogenic protein
MKKLTTTIVTIALIGTPAFAAPLPPPAPVYNWTGWYVGVNAGASFGNVKTDFNATPVIFGPQQVTPGFGFSDRKYPDGFIGGGQIGYNWRYSPLIIAGIEADFQGALERDSANLSNPFSFPIPAVALVTGTGTTDYTAKIDWFGTVRARIGYVWGNGDVMSYLTGGLAYGRVGIDGTNTVSGVAPAIAASFALAQAIAHSQVNTGWVVGYGTEGKLVTPGWTWKIEGLYVDLGTVDTTGVNTGSGIGFTCLIGVPCPTGGQLSTHSHFTDGILRVGLNYKFH